MMFDEHVFQLNSSCIEAEAVVGEAFDKVWSNFEFHNTYSKLWRPPNLFWKALILLIDLREKHRNDF